MGLGVERSKFDLQTPRPLDSVLSILRPLVQVQPWRSVSLRWACDADAGIFKDVGYKSIIDHCEGEDAVLCIFCERGGINRSLLAYIYVSLYCGNQSPPIRGLSCLFLLW